MRNKDLIKFINEAIIEADDYNFLGFENYKENDHNLELFKSKEFLNNLVDDIIFGYNKFKVIDEDVKEFEINDNRNIPIINIVYNVLIKYYYDNNSYEFIINFNGWDLKIKSKMDIDYSNVNISLYTKNDEIITNDLNKNIADNKKIKIFIEKFISPIIQSQIKN